MKNRLNFIIYLFFPLLAATAAQWINIQFDFTQDQRYTLDSSTIEILEKLDRPIKIDVFLTHELSDIVPSF